MSWRMYKIFPKHALYNSVGKPLEEAQMNLQAPDGLIASAFLMSLSFCAQSAVEVLHPTGQQGPANLYFLTLADSGERKTGTYNRVLAPVYKRDAMRAAEYKDALVQFRADSRYWAAKDAALQRKLVKAISDDEETQHLMRELKEHAEAQPCNPERNRILYESVTERPLMEALRGDSKSIAIVSDEGSIVLNGGATNKLATLNKAWDGPRLLTFDRADDSIEASDPRVTVSLTIQEKLFQDFMDKRGKIARESGFLARFLPCWPASTQGFRPMQSGEPNWEHLHAFHQRMDELLDASDARHKAGDTTRRLLSFSSEAKDQWMSVQNMIEPKLQQGGQLESVRDFASKFLEMVGRLAACMHHFEGISGDIISGETLERALKIGDYYFDQYVGIFGEVGNLPQEQKDANLLFWYLHARYWCQGAAVALRNDVRKCGPIRHQGLFERALAYLTASNWIWVSRDQHASRKGRLLLHLNPAVFNQYPPR